MICWLIPEIIVPWSVIITRYHWECSKLAATTIMIFFLIGNLFLGWTGRWPWFACQALIGITTLLLRIRTIPPNHTISFQADDITSWNSNVQQCLVTDFGENIWVNVLHGEYVLIHSSIENTKISFCVLEKVQSWNGDENRGGPRIDFSETLWTGVVGTGVDWLCNPDCRSKLTSIWRRMTDVNELTSDGLGLGFGDDRGGCGGIYACALWAGCRNGALLAISNEEMLDGICNVACPSFYRLIRFFLIQQYGAHNKV